MFAGSQYYGNDQQDHWDKYDVTGFSAIFVDGTNYNTLSDVDHDTISGKPIMNIGQGIYGCGEHSESGSMSREVFVRNYGHRIDSDGYNDTLVDATRSLTTIQRGGMVLLDHSNVKLTGDYDISKADLNALGNDITRKKYGVMNVSVGMLVANGSGIVLGSNAVGETPAEPVFIDSVNRVRSLYLRDGLSSYNQMGAVHDANWQVIGINADDNHLYRTDSIDHQLVIVGDPLTTAQENVIIFNDTSKMYVRYWDKKQGDDVAKQYYGQLQGFFRMKADSCVPSDLSRTFAYARPKLAGYPGVDHNNSNMSDGGFLSYNTAYNYYTHGGDQYTNTKQYPYLHPYLGWRAQQDMTDYRVWNGLPEHDTIWYVDGTRGWGNDNKSKKEGSGLYPDKPKKTIFGAVTYDAQTNQEGGRGGIVSEVLYDADRYLNFSYEKDIIYVVGALSAEDEGAFLCDSIAVNGNDTTHYPKYPLKLFRYPGGHVMSNGAYDNGEGGSEASDENKWGTPNPGANYGAMLNVQPDKNIAMQGVVMDGLYGLIDADSLMHKILPANTTGVTNYYNQTSVTEPLIVTHSGSTLSLSDSTVLKRGYNSTNAKDWYTDAFYYAGPVEAGHQGGAIYVDSTATLNVRDTIFITGNKQMMKVSSTDSITIESNVFLPTFYKSINITGNLNKKSQIGVTSPMANDSATYQKNTLSPVAVARNNDVASAAWTNCNFYDDQNWFFVNRHNPSVANGARTTYYEESLPGKGKVTNDTTLYFGWTWANVVRTQPDANSYVEQGSNITIKDAKGLAWLISKSAGLNRQDTLNFKDKFIQQTGDIDLIKYVWVPIGDSIPNSTDRKPFAGTYDGRGHLIENLSIEYIGIGDRIYERANYGLFGYVKDATINRTFVVNGTIKPANTAPLYIGGLVGCMDASTITNSEAAVDIYGLNNQNVVAGGLVAKMDNASSQIHSSMAMPDFREIRKTSTGTIGGLVGDVTAGTIQNSFVNARFRVDSDETPTRMGGLLGNNTSAKMENCYVALNGATTNLTTSNFGSIAATNATANNVDSCYVMTDASSFKYTIVTEGNGNVDKSCGHYTPVSGADMYGYMYSDNKVMSGNVNPKSDTTLFLMLNRWVDKHGNEYSRWARPGLAYNDTVLNNSGNLEVVLKTPLNGDLPVLLLNDADGAYAHQGNFRSVGTYAGGRALQYGGPVRDDNEVDAALTRKKVGASDYLFIYGDVNDIGNNLNITQNKVSIYEHASIMSAGSLANYDSTYVGITFDNSSDGQATSTPTINYGLLGYGGYLLPRDWHMFSSPLRNAPLGFDYQGHNELDIEDYKNNPWSSMATEFSWLQDPGYGNSYGYNRYWMYGWENSQSQQTQTVNMRTWKDGYFPSESKTFGEGWISDSDEQYRYPYGMDFYTWNEPEYHWVNFKRNGPNHWHSDEPHVNLKYVPAARPSSLPQYPVNQNEDSLIIGRGYMAAIATETFMQSHGRLNGGSVLGDSIMLTANGKNLTGWNLVGNPYHGYLDFEKLASQNGSAFVTGEEGYDVPFYVVYDADGHTPGVQGSGFLYYPKQGSKGGAYAGRYMHPHQGFYMKAKADSVMLHFDESMIAPRDSLGQTPVTDGHFRAIDAWRPNYPLVNLFLSSDHGCNDITVVELERPEWGGALKMKDLRVGNAVFYARHGETNYAALFAQKGVDRIPLWFDPHEDDIYTIKWNTANAIFHSMYLIDNIAGVQYDMLLNDSYTFEGHTEDYPSRFYIVFSLTDIEENVDITHQPFAFFDGSQWMVTGDGDLQFIDLLGRILAEKHVSGQTRISLPEVACGTYLFRLTNNQETKIQKIIINKK